MEFQRGIRKYENELLLPDKYEESIVHKTLEIVFIGQEAGWGSLRIKKRPINNFKIVA